MRAFVRTRPLAALVAVRVALVLAGLAVEARAADALDAAPAAPAAASEPVYLHTTGRGDTLIGLGRRLLADPTRWPELARANAVHDPRHLPIGTALRVPLRLMRSDAAPATVLGVTGQARSAAAALQPGQGLPEGGEVSTGADGHVSIRLVDGTLLRLRPGSRLQLSESRRMRDVPGVRSGARLEQGRVEIEAAPAAAGRPGFRIDTPQGVLGVRGTEFRVTSDGSTRGEVLAGKVEFSGRPGAAAQQVGAGYGSVIAAGGEVAAPVRLLPRPDLGALPALQERTLLRFALAPLAGARAYRGQVSADASFDRVVADLTSPSPELRFADLPDGDYVLRVRGIDALGLEGQDADHRFRLKARPEAPLPSAPAPKAVIFGDRAEFTWAANEEARSYHLHLAAGPDFKAPLRDLAGLTTLATAIDGLAPGTYHWQLASVRADGDQGPWGSARSFEIRPLPPTPKPPQVGEDTINFSWEGAPGQSFDFELARDAAFTRKVLERRLTQPGIDLPLPGTGRFYVRLRVRDADGFVGPYTAAQHFDVPNCVRGGTGGCVRAGSQTLDHRLP
jgi:hypothetical protein